MRTLPLLILLLLSACGALPQPFFGNPGSAGARLAQPPPARLLVPVPSEALLTEDAAAGWASEVAAALVERELPAEMRPSLPARNRDWALLLSAETKGGVVVPRYTVRNPEGKSLGVSDGAGIPAQDWASGNPGVLKKAAAQAAPGIVTLMATIDAAARQSDPNSLVNRPPRVYLVPIEGAPGDGNRTLAAQMRIKLANNGMVVQDTPKDADYEISLDIKTPPGSNGTVRVEMQWIVNDAKGERGRVVQLNEVPPRMINPYWGDVAAAATEEAAGGVRQVIINAGATKLEQTPVKPAAATK